MLGVEPPRDGHGRHDRRHGLAAAILGLVTRQPVLSLWMVLSAVVWCTLPGIGLARSLSRKVTVRRAALACVAALGIVGACVAVWG